MNDLRRIVLCFMLGLVAYVAWAAEKFTVGDFIYQMSDDGKDVTAIRYVGSKGNVIIPSEVTYSGKTYPVTVLGRKCFENDTTLVSVRIPSSVTFLETRCFNGCTSLTSCEIESDRCNFGYDENEDMFPPTCIHTENGIGYVGKYAVAILPGEYDELAIKDGTVGITARILSKDFFAGKLTLPKSLRYARFIFKVRNLSCPFGTIEVLSENIDSVICAGPSDNYLPHVISEKVVLNEKIREMPSGIGSYFPVPNMRYANWLGCFKELVLPSSIESIGDRAFCGCRGLTSIVIPSSVVRIGDNAFTECEGLTSIEIPNSVTSIGDRAFSSSGLTSIAIPSSVTRIENGVFQYCRRLTSIGIPSSVTSIGDCAFYRCYALSSIDIPNSVTSIGDQVFYSCI